MISRLLPAEITLFLCAALLIIGAVALGALDFQGEKRLPPALQGLGVFALVYGILMLTGAASGHSNLLTPLVPEYSEHVLAQRPPSAMFGYASTMTELQDKLDAAHRAHKPALVEFFASWCPDCKKVDQEVLSDPQIRKSMRALTAIRVDVSERNPELARMMEKNHVYGVPSMIFYDRDGKLFNADKMNDEITREGLQKTLDQLVS